MLKKLLITILALAVVAAVAVAYMGGYEAPAPSTAPQAEAQVMPAQESLAVPQPIEAEVAADAVAQPDEEAPEAEPEEAAVVQNPMPAVSENAKAHLCYLSFNNPHEASVARTFVNALAQYPEAPRITVTEYQAKGADPEEALERLVRSGVRCDGLVLSGHHDEDGEFWGDRTSGDLEIDFLVELSARPSLSSWFANVKSLWLQGCHTATTRVFNPEVDDDERISGSPLVMVNRHLEFDELEDSIDDLNDIFLENTEEDNIILSYARVFPSATIYTWWDLAPGVEAGSHWSFPYHIVQTSYVIDPSPEFFQHPFKRPIPKAAALRYAEILYEGMTRPVYPGKHAGPLAADEDTLIKGWKEHGRWAFHKRPYSFENASAVGHRSLLSSDSGILKQLRGFTVLLAQLDEEWVAEDASSIVKTILDNEEYIPYNVYLLWAFAQRSPRLKARMVASAGLRDHLDTVINTPGKASQEKRDYQRFYNYLFE